MASSSGRMNSASALIRRSRSVSGGERGDRGGEWVGRSPGNQGGEVDHVVSLESLRDDEAFDGR